MHLSLTCESLCGADLAGVLPLLRRPLQPLRAQRHIQPLLEVLRQVAGGQVTRAEHRLGPLSGHLALPAAQACSR